VQWLLCCCPSAVLNLAMQCGFCTPGMAIACHAALHKAASHGREPTARELRDALDGNLCRCTGYRPIVDACKVGAWCVNDCCGCWLVFAGRKQARRTCLCCLQSWSCDADIEDLGLNAYGPAGLPARPDAASVLSCTKGQQQQSSDPTPAASHNSEQEDEQRAHAEARAAVVQALQVSDLGPAQKLYVPHSMQQLAQVGLHRARVLAGAGGRITEVDM
jgi:xanthine dehydrogenase iron-sulfur cluster and FAD-binding subunit A